MQHKAPLDPAAAADLLSQCNAACDRLKQQVATVVVGQQAVVDSLLTALLARGHALLVGVPGLAKTLLVSAMAQSLGLSFGRVQFTPDLLPADITGSDVLNEVEEGNHIRRRLEFLPGPIFKNLVLADEINRTPPKTQAALLQAMQERCVTVGGKTHALPGPFQVFATRNPIEQEGTYSLPEAQLDRFLLEIHLDYPTEEEESAIANPTSLVSVSDLQPVIRPEELIRFGELVPLLPITSEAVALAVALCRASRPTSSTATAEVKRYIRYGAGPRGSQALVLAAKARAAMRGDAAADVEDILAVSGAALRHRIVLSYRAEAEEITRIDLVRTIVKEQQGRLKL